jgi:chromosome segregation ATPase
MTKLRELENGYLDIWGRAERNGAKSAFDYLKILITKAIEEESIIREELGYNVKRGLIITHNGGKAMIKLKELENGYLDIWGRAEENGAKSAAYKLKKLSVEAIKEERSYREDLEYFIKSHYQELKVFTDNLLSTAGVSIKVDDLIKSKSMQDDIAKQVKAKMEQSSGYGEVLDLYKQKTQEMERTLKELEELKKEMGGTEAEKEEAKRKIQEQEEKLKKQETSLKAKESENEEYNNIAEQMLRMQIEIERLKKENELLKEDRDDFKDVTLDIKQDTDELNTQNEQGSHEDL